MFDFDKIVEDFLNEKPFAYINDIKAFKEFLLFKGADSSNIKIVLQGLRTETIIESLEYYIHEKNITSVETAQRYISAIKEFLAYMLNGYLENKDLQDELFYPVYNEKSYRFRMNKFIGNCNKLNRSEGFDTFSTNDINDLLYECNKTLASKEVFEKSQKTRSYFNKFSSALILKLILFSGVTYRVISKLKIQDLDISQNMIKINGYHIHLPNSFQQNFKDYCDLRSKLINDFSKNSLFIKFDGSQISNMTSDVSIFMNNILGRGDLNGLIKYTISQMIRNGMNETIIKEFTGVGDVIYIECHNIVFNSNEIKVRHLDSKLRSLEMFNKI